MRGHNQCFAVKFHNWGQCPRAPEKVGTSENRWGHCGKIMGQRFGGQKSVFHQFTSLLTIF